MDHLPITESQWAELRRSKRVPLSQPGRMAYGGPDPGMLHCEILDLSETGVRVKLNFELSPMPEFFSIEFLDVYCRVRRRWHDGSEVGLEFIFDEA